MRVGERLHMVFRVVMGAFFTFIIILSLLLFIFTLTQFYAPNAGDSSTAGGPFQDRYGHNRLDTPCDQSSPDDFASHRPLRFTRPDNVTKSDDGLGDVFTYCGWSQGHTTGRGIISFLCIPLACWMFDRLRRRTPASGRMWLFVQPKRTMIFLMLPCIVAVLVFVIMIGVDGSAVATSYQWCTGELSNKYAGTDNQVNCVYDPFIAIILIETFIVICWLLQILFIGLRIKFFIQYMEVDDEPDMDMPSVSKSRFSFAKNKGKGKGRH